jgi:hypothetical protein
LAAPITLAPLAASRALASFGDEQRDKAMLLLSGYHGIGSKADFEAALAEPEALLASIARDASSVPSIATVRSPRSSTGPASRPSRSMVVCSRRLTPPR